MSFTRTKEGVWKLTKAIKGAHPSYVAALEKALNGLDAVFCRAKEKSEFEFIQALLRIRGLQDAGWDSFETLIDVSKTFSEAKRKLRGGDKVTHIALFMFGLIIESSEPYELLANLLNIVEGGRFNLRNFPDYKDQKGRNRSQHPMDKINQLISRAKKNRLDLSILTDFADMNLRNAVFHSDYVIYGSSIRTLNPQKYYANDEWLSLVNRAISYYETLLNLYRMHIVSYNEPKVIDVHPDFSADPDEKAVTIIRKKHGLIGIRDNWTDEELKEGHIPFRLCRHLPYESRLLDQRQLTLPPNRITKINRLLRWFPKGLKPYIAKLFANYTGRGGSI